MPVHTVPLYERKQPVASLMVHHIRTCTCIASAKLYTALSIWRTCSNKTSNQWGNVPSPLCERLINHFLVSLCGYVLGKFGTENMKMEEWKGSMNLKITVEAETRNSKENGKGKSFI